MWHLCMFGEPLSELKLHSVPIRLNLAQLQAWKCRLCPVPHLLSSRVLLSLTGAAWSMQTSTACLASC